MRTTSARLCAGGRQAAPDLTRDEYDIIRILANGAQHSLATVDSVSNVIPILATGVPEEKDRAGMHADSEIEIYQQHLTRNSQFNETCQLASERDSMGGVFH